MNTLSTTGWIEQYPVNSFIRVQSAFLAYSVSSAAEIARLTSGSSARCIAGISFYHIAM